MKLQVAASWQLAAAAQPLRCSAFVLWECLPILAVQHLPF